VIIKYGLQPLLIIAVLGAWFFNQTTVLTYPAILLLVQVLLNLLEYWRPLRPHWRHSWREKLGLVGVYVAVFGFSAAVVAPLYTVSLDPILVAARAALHINIWPTQWPILMQVLLAFFLSEFIWYWFHRAEHRWRLLWRLSGHGAHHSFKHLGAVNAGANHPLEMFILLVPSAIVELLFGGGLAVAGAAVLILTQASIAHANIDLNHRVIGWLFTTNRYHIHHHSSVMAQSNTNYGCAAILWDRVFGTFAEADTLEAGIGPTEPTLLQKLMMPLREPDDARISPGLSTGRAAR
jgi:sterol desaturase/sphingolipid hydroxylase (fatty acid hydroxylase superfamily)